MIHRNNIHTNNHRLKSKIRLQTVIISISQTQTALLIRYGEVSIYISSASSKALSNRLAEPSANGISFNVSISPSMAAHNTAYIFLYEYSSDENALSFEDSEHFLSKNEQCYSFDASEIDDLFSRLAIVSKNSNKRAEYIFCAIEMSESKGKHLPEHLIFRLLSSLILLFSFLCGTCVCATRKE